MMCPRCEGGGVIDTSPPGVEYTAPWLQTDTDCPDCDGTGLLLRVVINPDDRGQVERLTRAMDDQFAARGWNSIGDDLDPEVVDSIQAALRTFGGDET